MSSGVLFVGLTAVLAALLLVAFVVLPAPRRVPMSRLDPKAVAPSSAIAGAGAAAGAMVEKVLSKRGRLARGAAALERAGLGMALPDFVLLVGVLAVVAGGLGFLVGGPWLVLPAAGLVLVGARMMLSLKISRRQAAFADQLDDSLQLMASSLRAGHSILRAVDAVAQEAASPTAEEFARVINETRVGRGLTEALDQVADRMASDDFSWVAQAVAIQHEVGGNLAEILDAVSRTIRERNAIRRQVKALAAEGKLSAYVLMGLPVVIVAFLGVVTPSYIGAFTSSFIGYGMILAAVLLLVMGGLWLKKMVRVDF
jgi:tight adherence protein B